MFIGLNYLETMLSEIVLVSLSDVAKFGFRRNGTGGEWLPVWLIARYVRLNGVLVFSRSDIRPQFKKFKIRRLWHFFWLRI